MRDNIQLTGRIRYRTSFWGKVVVQVEETYNYYSCEGGGSYSPTFSSWRDAKTEDLLVKHE